MWHCENQYNLEQGLGHCTTKTQPLIANGNKVTWGDHVDVIHPP